MNGTIAKLKYILNALAIESFWGCTTIFLVFQVNQQIHVFNIFFMLKIVTNTYSGDI